MKTVRRQQSVQVVRAGSCWGAPPQAAAATTNSSTRQVSALLRGGHAPTPHHQPAPAHRTKGLLEGRASPDLKARMATVRAVLMRGLAANLAPNSWRQEGHAFFLALFTRSCRVERLWVARQGSVRRFQGRRDRCSLPSFVGGALPSQHGSRASGSSAGMAGSRLHSQPMCAGERRTWKHLRQKLCWQGACLIIII